MFTIHSFGFLTRPDSVTEYLADTTNNPLVVGHNVTTRSDLRIFSSDGNKTMEKYAISA